MRLTATLQFITSYAAFDNRASNHDILHPTTEYSACIALRELPMVRRVISLKKSTGVLFTTLFEGNGTPFLMEILVQTNRKARSSGRHSDTGFLGRLVPCILRT